MTRGAIRQAVVSGKLEILRQMRRGITSLPLTSRQEFLADPRMVAAGESFLRRSLEALLDLGRHLLAKGFGVAASEYKAIPRRLEEHGVLDSEAARSLVELAGYRNRMVHFYDQVTPEELFEVLTKDLWELDRVVATLTGWLAEHPELLDQDL